MRATTSVAKAELGDNGLEKAKLDPHSEGTLDPPNIPENKVPYLFPTFVLEQQQTPRGD